MPNSCIKAQKPCFTAKNEKFLREKTANPYTCVLNCGCSSVVEHHVANVRVVSSNLITRLNTRNQCGCSSAVEHHVANVRVVSSNLITRFSTTDRDCQ